MCPAALRAQIPVILWPFPFALRPSIEYNLFFTRLAKKFAVRFGQLRAYGTQLF